MTFVLLASFEELINSKCFFHFEGLTKNWQSKAAQIPFNSTKSLTKIKHTGYSLAWHSINLFNYDEVLHSNSYSL